MPRKSRSDKTDYGPFVEGLERADRLLRYLRPRDYDVGYGKPPQEHQFKPGQSGNPKGRPPGFKGRVFAVEGSRLRQALQAELGREVIIEERGGSAKVVILDLIIRKLVQKALAGQSRAAAILLENLATAERDELREHRELVEAIMEFQKSARLELQRRADEGIRGGMPILPHPDDIEVEPMTGAIALHGPASESESAAFSDAARQVETLRGWLKDMQAFLERDDDGSEKLPPGHREVLLQAGRRFLDQIWQIEEALQGRKVTLASDEPSG